MQSSRIHLSSAIERLTGMIERLTGMEGTIFNRRIEQ
jgi:hypothetical protein